MSTWLSSISTGGMLTENDGHITFNVYASDVDEDGCITDPPTLAEMARATKIVFAGLKKLKRLPDHMPNVKRLECSGCSTLTYIPNGLTTLEYLDCSGCGWLEALPTGMVHLEYLACKSCIFHTLPDDMIHLESLNLTGCANLDEIPPGITRRLLHLWVVDTRIKSLPDGMRNLQLLHCRVNDVITKLPSGLTGIHRLFIFDCPNLKWADTPYDFSLEMLEDEQDLVFTEFSTDIRHGDVEMWRIARDRWRVERAMILYAHANDQRTRREGRQPEELSMRLKDFLI